MIRLLEVKKGDILLTPTAHCQNIRWLRVLQEKWPTSALKIYSYLFYMAYPGEENPYFNISEALKEDTIVDDIEIEHALLEEDEVIEALEKITVLYATPTVRAYNGIVAMMDNITDYMTTAKPTSGRDGNLPTMIRLAKDFDDLRQSYKGVFKDVKEEEASVRGNSNLAYDSPE